MKTILIEIILQLSSSKDLSSQIYLFLLIVQGSIFVNYYEYKHKPVR